jgi:hypothetical protein
MLSRTWHPHLGILEIATDTGLLGVLGYLLFLIMVARWDAGHQHSRTGCGDDVSVYRTACHVPVIQRVIDVLVPVGVHYLAGAGFGPGGAF